MQSHGRGLVASVALVMALVLLGAGGVGRAQAPQAEVAALPPPGFTVRVAVLVPRTGGAASIGESVVRGIKLANEVLSPEWDLDVVTVDTQCDGAVSGPAASQVISDGIRYILGAVCTGASIPVSEIAEANGVLQISPTSTGANVTTYPDGTDKRYVFRTCLADPVQARVMAAVADGIVGARTAGVLYNSDSGYSLSTANEFADAFEQRGGVVAPYAGYTMDDRTGAVAELQGARPDVVFVTDESVVTLNSLVADIRTAGITATLLGGDAWDTPDLDLGVAEGAYFPSFFAIEDDRQAVIDFVAEYEPYFGEEPDGWAALGYDTMALLLTAISQAGVDDATTVRDALVDITFEGVTGRMTFDAVGDPLKMLAVVTIENGQRRLARRVASQESRSLAAGGTITTTDSAVTLETPATLTHTLTVTYTPQLTTTQSPGDLIFGGVAFGLELVDDEGNPIVELSEPLSLTVHYLDAALAPGTDESTLEVRRWDADTQAWVALELVSRDTEANAITVLLDHLSEFALLAPVRHDLYVPVLRR